MPKITFICYGQQLTGSKNIREYNKVWGDENYKLNKLTEYGNYCYKYDKELPLKPTKKELEPFFDYIAARIMTLDKDTFEKYFEYRKVNLQIKKKTQQNKQISVLGDFTNNNLPKNNLNNNSLTKETNKQKEGLLSPFKFEGRTWVSFDADVNEIYKMNQEEYKNGNHIFIGGPITNKCFKAISDAMDTIDNLFIHFQGESPALNHPLYKDNGGIFANAFNIQNSIYNYYKFRKLLKQKSAITLTVTPKSTNNHSFSYNKNNKTKIIPFIYKSFYDSLKFLVLKNVNVYNRLSMQPTANSKQRRHQGINIVHIYQDIYDKDNFASVYHLVNKSKIPPKLILTGVPLFEDTGKMINIENTELAEQLKQLGHTIEKIKKTNTMYVLKNFNAKVKGNNIIIPHMTNYGVGLLNPYNKNPDEANRYQLINSNLGNNNNNHVKKFYKMWETWFNELGLQKIFSSVEYDIAHYYQLTNRNVTSKNYKASLFHPKIFLGGKIKFLMEQNKLKL